MKKLSLPFRKKKIKMVDKAPNKNGDLIPIVVSELTIEHAKWWHSQIQPIIDDNSDRADQYWNWILISASSNIAGKFFSKKPAGYTVGFELDGNFIPCGMIQLIGKFPYLINRKKKSVFVWFLTVAPFKALTSLKNVNISADKIPKRIGSILLDISVTHSFNIRNQGRTSLHAAIEGGEKLLNWYSSRGMDIYPEDENLHFGIRRLIKPSDGRYCYFTEKGALTEIKEFDPYR
jgi:hypothetical protein